MQLIQVATTMDSTQAMQMKFEQRLDDVIKYELAHEIARQLMDSEQFIIQTQRGHPIAYPAGTTITFFVELYISYKKE